MTNAIDIVASVQAKEGHEAEVEKIMKAAVPPSRAEAGNVKYDVHKDLQHKGHFVFIERWANNAAIGEHGATPHFQKLVHDLEPISDGLDVVFLECLTEKSLA
ncbi:MAG: putative quinol monooxygenase [Zymomonas mobilis subsp. pomaceae]|uniref:Antibiotic biosynthesis monooxygenase n=1 Tax=Zymomonas mobilis subsp. pomaceae (strain ATCC 29192 / DSM 22645 / JCM 10191 / CCUG 17912 / NBRC 13757 / NCIMB 11200 / NRRL B-4491 / Barker I) TaxID=579138 RepID=F8EW05_ZYMMT|nr:putative quinol monooxygenase [Zymomonas mobilis]AEI38415.1 Antibiotic biosynthesis monooxygenase [Zymomonas mobilis subsp. pomaceae ATCC 29192]MDX5948105.1 putative quinol monooxygenase [Zymomonas mobilis subsp. pomaceae]GEB90033.1 antibiotic biosynthesis monooxygenase [Zymomonas mobilis subsp. pomaceae]